METEPYDYKLPVAEEVAMGQLGWAVRNSDFEIMLYIVVSFHGWIRPQEVAQMLGEDVVFFPGHGPQFF